MLAHMGGARTEIGYSKVYAHGALSPTEDFLELM